MQLKSTAKPKTIIELKTRHAVCRMMSKVYPTLLKRFTIRLKRSEKFGFPMIFLNLYTKSPYHFRLQIPCCISFFFQTDMIFFDHFKVPTIKFGKCFAEMALLKEFGS